MVENSKFFSGMVSRCSYNEQNKTLEVTTNDGFVYRYFDVPADTILKLIESVNPGDFYNKNIRTKFKRLLKSFDYSVI